MKAISTGFQITTILILFLFSGGLKAESLRKVASLPGYWKFSIGDDSKWSDPSFDDSSWDQISGSRSWEDQGYSDYNGYAWYRKTFSVDEMPDNTPLYLMLGRIDDVDVVYLNGKKLGNSGSFPPNYISAYNRNRKYVIPEGLLNETGKNVIAIKVYDSYGEGGMVDGYTGIFIDGDLEYLNLNLTGRWKIKKGDNKDWKAVDVDDNNWQRINVPSDWDSYGMEDYDGYAWYRVKFRVPANFMSGDLYLSLGKIDDIDDVYLNGKYIGSVYDLRSEYRRWGGEYNARRLYRFNGNLLNRDGLNTLAVRVYDGQERGGIYEGPIGIMSPENYRKYRSRHYSEQSFWDFFFDSFHID